MKIGFIGLGNMGTPMAENLANSGFDVYGYDLIKNSVSGVTCVDNLVSAVEQSDVVITMLPDGKSLLKVYNQIVKIGKKNSVFIDCSTVDIESALMATSIAETNGLRSMDAPVSGGVVGAKAATLTFMVGGSQDTFEEVFHIFDVMGQKAVLCGGNGAGQTTKLCNNMILGISMIGVCEAFALADSLNLDRQKMFDVVSTSSGYCWSLNAYCPAPGVGPKSPSDENYTPGFSAELMLKDLSLAQTAAKNNMVLTTLGEQAKELYTKFVGSGGAKKDFSAILNYIKGF